MSLLGRLAHDALASHHGVVDKARAQLDKELQPVATGPFTWRLVQVAELLGTSDAMTESLKTLLGAGKLRVDRVLFAEVPTSRGTLEIALPFSGKDTLSPQFSLRLSVRAPAGALLERSLMGSWGFGNWVPSQGFEEQEAAKALCEKLEEANVSADIVWDCELPGDYLWKLPWTLQLVPSGPGQSRLLMQSGRQGIFFTRFGVDVFLKKAEQSLSVLQSLSSFPEAAPGAIEECWADRVAPMVAANPAFGTMPPPGAVPGPTSAPPGTHGPRTPTLPNDPQAKLNSRGVISLVLAGVGLLVCCAPVGLVGGGLALHTRSEANKLGLQAPGTTIAALVLAIVSVLMMGLVGTAAVLGRTERAVETVKGKKPAVQVQDRTVAADESRRTDFRILKVFERHQPGPSAPFHVPGGEWTYFDAALTADPTCRFTVGVSPGKDAGGVEFGKVALSVPDVAAAECLVDTLAADFDVDLAELPEGGSVTGATLASAVLGRDVARGKHGGFSGKGSWVATKLFFASDAQEAEVFLNFDLTSKRGEFSEKDEGYNQAMVDLLAAALVKAPAAAPAKKTPKPPAKPTPRKR